ncbi:MAG TPA: hypothetical protein VGC92_05605, partial [Phenylobacterium sp.]
MRRDRIRRAALPPPQAGVAASLTFYPPGLEQSAHDHADSHISVVLTGAFEERHRSDLSRALPGDMLLRDAGVRHAVVYGAAGALILTLRAARAGADAASAAPARAAVRRHAEAAVPAWLEEARSRLLAQPATTSLSRLARDFGVHRVHLSRSFQAHFGAPPSVVRRE